MTETEISRWQTALRAEAHAVVLTWAWHQDRALVDDLVAAGWIALLEAPRLSALAIRDRMRNACCLWLYGVTKGRQPRRVRQDSGVRLEDLVDRDGTPLEQLEAKEAVVQRLTVSRPMPRCLDCGRGLTGHGGGIRCRSCATRERNRLRANGRGRVAC